MLFETFGQSLFLRASFNRSITWFSRAALQAIFFADSRHFLAKLQLVLKSMCLTLFPILGKISSLDCT